MKMGRCLNINAFGLILDHEGDAFRIGPAQIDASQTDGPGDASFFGRQCANLCGGDERTLFFRHRAQVGKRARDGKRPQAIRCFMRTEGMMGVMRTKTRMLSHAR